MGAVTLTKTRMYRVSPDAMWRVISDLDAYAAHAPGLAVTEVLAGSGVGAERRCETDSGQDWRERVVEWDEGHRYTIEVDTGTYPLPLRLAFRTFKGTWEVEPVAEGCSVTLRFEGRPRWGSLGSALVRRMATRSEGDLEKILDSYGEAVTRS